jgi:uncharacterized membrane protein YhiD involved in acid resistance
MTFKDILKNKFIEEFMTSGPTFSDIVIALLIAGIIGMYIFMIYRIVTRKTFYSKNFNISLVALTLITAAIILTIQSSVVVSLGMVGALSIVRFRTAIKDPMDLVFLFWAISIGIICGAGLHKVAVLLSAFVTVAVLLLDLIPVVKSPLLLVVNCSDIDCESNIISTIKKYTKSYHISSRNLSNNHLDMVIELRLKNQLDFIKEIAALPGVTHASLVSRQGDTIS